MKRKEVMKKRDNMKKVSIISLAIFSVLIALTIFNIVALNILPNKYLFPIVAVLVIFVGLFWFLFLRLQNKGIKNLTIIVIVTSLLLSILNIFVSLGRNRLEDFINDNFETQEVSLIVPVESTIQEAKELQDANIGAFTRFSPQVFEKTMPLFQQKYELTFNVIEGESYKELYDSLIDGSLPALMLNESQRGLFNEIDSNFNETTRVVATVSYQEAKTIQGNSQSNKDILTIFVSGIDTYGSLTSVSRSDVNMVVVVNKKTHQILMVSIPRDYHVELASFGAYDKLTHAGIYGVEESMATLSNLFGIGIDHYVRVNFSSVENIVDQLGGVDVYSEFSFSVPGVSVTEGKNHLSGSEALRFVRERKLLPNGDGDRIKNQQALLKGVIQKLLSPDMLMNFDGVLEATQGNFQTSIDYNTLSSLVKEQLATMPNWDMQTISVTGYATYSESTYSMPGWNLYVLEPDYESVQVATAYMNQMINNEVISVQ